MAKKNASPVKVNPKTKDILKRYQRELEYLEGDRISLGEIIKRMARGEDILDRLKKGALERRRKRC